MSPFNPDHPLLAWLLEGDVAIQYQVWRDLLDETRPELQARIATEGWGAHFLRLRRPDGHWGQGFYRPKWTSTHYTLLDLKQLAITPDHPAIRASVEEIAATRKAADGGVNPSDAIKQSDVCINGMFLQYAAYFHLSPQALRSIVDFLLEVQMPDGGFNCQSNRGGAGHSSLHSTLSVLEGIAEYAHNGYTYRLEELQTVAEAGRAFILQHRLFRSDRTGAVIDPRFLMLSYPSRWRYDILRALDYLRLVGQPDDSRLEDALAALLGKRRVDGTWPLQARHPGQTHFEMEQPGRSSRWNTLRALRVLGHFRPSALLNETLP
ncbi:MAG: hypothetical protein HXY38_15260 [Chloroflexi bacterium]|nr:hypothetical protein [Chloroflexota bacterium]